MEPAHAKTSGLKAARIAGSLWLATKYVFVAFCIIVPFRFFIAQPFIVSGTSMEPIFTKGDYIVIDEISYRQTSPQRGDVIIFRYPLDPSIYFIKRVIGLPGETIRIENGIVSISNPERVSFVVLDEPYRVTQNKNNESSTTKLDRDEYFVMGDNRDSSADSRVWGPLQERFIIGRAIARLFPFNEISLFPGRYEFPKK
jgi:signal peptidase I